MIIELDNEIINSLVLNTVSNIEKSKYFKKEEISEIQIDRKNGIIYFIYVRFNNQFILKYIGKSNGKGFKTRLRAHFFGIGRGTQSKYDKIRLENEVAFKFIETKPNALRNLLEEILIEKYTLEKDSTLWNYK